MRITFILLTAVFTLAAQSPEKDAIFRAMKDELDRSMKKLQLEQLDKPYFVSYRVVDTHTIAAGANYGALSDSSERKNRRVAVEVRIGDYARDNTNFFALRFGPSGVVRAFADGGITTPLDDDYDEIRRQLWLATDSAYKQALDDWAKKKAVLENRTRVDDAPDFSKEPPSQTTDLTPEIKWTLAAAEKNARDLSALFRGVAGIDHSAVRVTATNTITRFLSTEGTRFTRVEPVVRIVASADTQAADGTPLADAETFAARSLNELPSNETMARDIRALQKRLLALRDSQPLDKRYTGPVLIEGQAAGELIGQTLAPAFIGLPRLVTDNQTLMGAFGSDEGGMREKLGSRILPAFLNITDDASLKTLDGQPLLGGHVVDEEGVPGRANRVIERGVFKQMLNTRALVGGAERSTGNRRSAGAMPTNVILSTTQPTPAADMKTKLIALAKERGLDYGIVIRRIANALAPKPQGAARAIMITIGGHGGAGNQGYKLENTVEAYKVYADGREELIQPAQISGLMLGNFRDIVAVSDRPHVYTNAFRNTRQSPLMSGPIFITTPLVSFAVPSLLFDEVSLQRPIGETPKLPYTGHPSFDRSN